MCSKARKIILALVFAMLILGAGATQSDPCLVYNTDTVSVVFDDTYTTATPPVTLVRVDAEVLSAAGAPVTVWQLTTGWTLVDGAWKIPVRTLAATLANGDYQVRVRVWDAYGNVSGWSETMWVSKQWRTLPTPGGCRTTS
jgi:hypothetical protein